MYFAIQIIYYCQNSTRKPSRQKFAIKAKACGGRRLQGPSNSVFFYNLIFFNSLKCFRVYLNRSQKI
jgi:hypothetical protein